ncbi:amino acid adenylation domain-containing protein/non-ribosomal peptide synthase protein (TIGR01720 family) [Actinokineospora baliensis]|uniref:non-ribosomal peptide synthetase n=1 Tax=Actinokineospora baliensis TaxID=547056 RepID=UPI00195C38CC|nr:non-ribosomal peptide synthetase [Actinokineospora baliensis]MBM7774388.1 amino acid adenylation domain-containing protein/non-ribosomal peptide synthase protein (TIGR01720 family) [Actinokineospora baliensis]
MSSIEDILPLSPLQSGMLFHATTDESTQDVYLAQLVLDLAGPLDAERLRAAVHGLTKRHSALRSAFVRDVGDPIQVVLADVEPPWVEIDLTGADADRRADELLAADRATRFDLDQPPLIRAMLLRFAADRHRLVLTNHHLVMDGWSTPLLMRDLFALYAGETLPQARPFRDHLAWLANRDKAESLVAWKDALGDLDTATLLVPAAVHADPVLPSEVVLDIPGLTAFARGQGVTTNTVVQVAWGILASRLTGRDDVVFGATVAGRPADLPGVESMVGLFINTIPVRLRLNPGERVDDLLARVQDEQAELLDHQHVGLAEVQRAIGSGVGELFDSLVVFESFPFDTGAIDAAVASTGLRVTATSRPISTHYPLTLMVMPHGDSLEFTLKYRPDLVTDPEGLLGRLRDLLAEIVAHPRAMVAVLGRVTVEPPRAVPAVPTPESTLVELFAAQVARTPDAPAVEFHGDTLTYAELDARAEALAARLPVGPEDLVAIVLPRSADLVIAALAVVKAGAGYLPIDPGYPAERIQATLADAEPVAVITDLDAEFVLPTGRRRAGADNVAYVIYTSGSTGAPKGVIVTHRDVVTLLTAARPLVEFGPGDVWTLFHSFAFDFSVWEMWAPLVTGGTLVVVPHEISRSPEDFRALLAQRRVTVLNQTPSAYYQLDTAGLPDLRVVIFGGEALDPTRLTPGPRLINMYGITETTVHVTFRELDPTVTGSVIGLGLPGLTVHVLDSALAPVPVGVPGEMYVGGGQLARGYLGRPGLTASRFVANPFGEGRLYRSGDLARWTESGELEYLGRADDQVKIRGFRVEVGETEAVLATAPGVTHAAVVARTDGPSGVHLAAYIVGTSDLDVVREHLRARLPEHMLPAGYVVLDALPLTGNGKLDRRALPPLDFGATTGRPASTDTERLLADLFAQVLGRDTVGVDQSFFELGGDSIISIQLVGRARAAGVVLSPRQVFELRTVAELAAAVDRVADQAVPSAVAADGVGEVNPTPIMRTFLARGGPFERFSQAVLVPVPLGATRPTVAGALQTLLDHHDLLRARSVLTNGHQQTVASEDADSLVHAVERTDPDLLRVSSVLGDGHEVTVAPAGADSLARGVERTDDPDLLQTLTVADDGHELTVAPVGSVDADSLVHRVERTDDPDLLRREHAAAVARLDRAGGVLVQLTWFDPGFALLTCHHVATDGYSCQILADDLAAALRGEELPPVVTSFRAWAERLPAVAAARAAELPLWRAIVDGPDPVLGTRRLDPARDTRETVREVTASLPVVVTDALLTTVPAAFHTGPAEVLMAAFGRAVAVWRGTEERSTVVTVEAHGREQHVVDGADISRTVGWFTTQYPVRLDVTGDLAAAVKRVKQHVADLPDRGIGYGLLRHFTDSGLDAFPEPQILFNYIGRVAPPVDDPLGFARIGFGGVAPAADLGLPAAAALVVNAVVPDGGGLEIQLRYPAGLFAEDQVSRLADLWVAELAVLASYRGQGGRTPSDLPLVEASQADVELWEERFPALSDVLPLSPLQQGLLFHANYDADAVDFYSVQLVVDLHGPVDVTRLRSAAASLVARHPVLRTAFCDETTTPAQVVLSDVAPTMVLLDLTAQAYEEFLEADRRARFDLTRPPLVRLTLVRLADDDYRLVVTNHHLVLDGWSTPLVVRDLFALYEGRALAAPPRPYRDFLAWLTRRDHDTSLSAWANVLDGVDEPTLLVSADLGDASVLPAEVVDAISPELTARLTRAARANGVTLNTLLSAAWGVVLGALTGRDDVVFGLAVSGRPPELAGVESMVGLFINTVPVRVRWSPGDPVSALLTRLHDARTSVLDHEHVGLSDIQALTPVTGRLFDTLMVFETFPLDTADLLDPARSGDLTARVGWSRGYTHYPMTLMLMPDGDLLRIKLEYRADVFERDAVAEVLNRVLAVLAAFADDQGTELSRVDVLGADERGRVLAWAGTDLPTRAVTVPDLIAVQAPDAVAVVCGDVSLTFAELGARSDRLAAHLVSLGVGPETPVALLLPRSTDVVVAMLAVWKAGGVTVPLDPTYPAERVAAVLVEAAPVAVITHRGLTDEPAVFADEPETWTGQGQPQGPVGPDSAAYIVFTSGSTGKPKGVVATHRGVVNLTAAHRQAFIDPAGERLGRPVRALNVLSFAFDGSVDPLLWLFAGHELHILPDHLIGDPQGIVDHVRTAEIDFIDAPPSLMDLLIPAGLLDGPLSVVATGAEAVGNRLWDQLAAAEVTALNLYGPTECTVDALWTVVDQGDPHIGRPVANGRAYVLDSALRLVPVGVPGELYIAGAGLARGYLGRPWETAARFVANPFGAGRLYRTGDMVRWTRAGTVEFLGRVDDQVKIRGYRVEPGEVESVLSGLPGVAQAAVVARDGRLVAYVTGPAATAELRSELARLLPDHLVPAAIVPLEALPKQPNGKLDRRALPAPDFSGHSTRQPATDTEHLVHGLFADLLDVPSVGMDDSFFALGGHSLLAARLVARLRAEVDGPLSIRAVFDTPTAAGLAAHLDTLAGSPSRPVLRAATRPNHVPLSAAQARLWFHDRLNGPSAAYTMPFASRLTGSLDLEALRRAFDDVVARHEILRTVLEEHDGVPHQRVLEATVPFTVTDTADPEKDLARSAAEPFRLDTDIPIRVKVFRVAADEHVLLLTIHHSAADDWSTGPLLRDLAIAYSARKASKAPAWAPLPLQYADYALWQQKLLSSVAAEQLAHWSTVLDGVPNAIALPVDRPRPATPIAAAGRVRAEIPADTVARLRPLLTDTGASELMLAHAAVAVLLHKLGGGVDIPLGALVAGRGEQAVADLVGFFVNTVVLRVDLSGDPTPRELLGRVREVALSAYANADVPFERVVEAVNPEREPGRHPLFQTLVDYWNPDGGPNGLPGLTTTVVDAGAPAAPKFDLAFGVTTGDGALLVSAEFAEDLFDRATVERLLDRLHLVVEAIVAAPDLPLSRMSVLDERERHLVLEAWNDNAVAVPALTAVDLFAEQVAASPDAVAVVGGGSATFRELDDLSDRLAAHLVSLGVGPEDRVAVVLPRSVSVVIAMLAVWKTGGVVVPVDPTYPADRIALVLDDANPAVVIGSAVPGRTVVTADPATWTGAGIPVGVVAPDSAAYLIHTSGSTGRPKGVVGTHRGLVNLAWSHRDAVMPQERLRVLNAVSFAFDAAVDPVLWLLSGHEMHILPQEAMGDPRAITQYVRSAAIDYVDAPPSLLELLLDEGLLEGDHRPSVVATGAEAVGPHLWERIAAADVLGVNFYGPTEATVDASWARITPDRAPHIGGPIANARLYVLDQALSPVPAGVPGELYIGGPGVARGYHGKPGETAARFVANPFGSGRLYRTGDLVRWTDAGTVEFLGRVDDQVKIRGYRVEPGEVEAALIALADVRQAVVVARGDALVGYVTALPETDGAAVRDAVALVLPQHLVPSRVVVLDEFPLLPNGKLDRKSLPVPDAVGGRAPATATEETVARVYATLLDRDQVCADDSFFDLGGHSLLAARLIAKIRSELDVDLSVRAVFEAPTVAGLASLVDQASRSYRPTLVARPRPNRVPLSAAQARLWFLHKLDGPSGTYNVPFAVRLGGALDVDALRAALGDVIARHESLRTIFIEENGVPSQHILDEVATPFTVREASESLVQAEADYPFDLSREIPIRATVLRLGADDHVFVLVVHHIASDEWSTGPLLRDLADAYAARRDGTAPDWAPLPVQYADYTLWQNDLLDGLLADQLGYWTRTLSELPEAIPLPTDHPRVPKETSPGGVVRFTVPANVVTGLRTLGREVGATDFMVVTTAVTALLHKLGAGKDIPLGALVAGRGDDAITDLVGFFVNTVVLRTDLAGDPTLRDVLARVREAALGAFANADAPFDRVVDAVKPDRAIGRHPLFQTMVDFRTTDTGTATLPGVSARPVTGTLAGGAKFDLAFNFAPMPDGSLDGSLEYDASLFEHASAQTLTQRLGHVLSTAAAAPTTPLSKLDVLDPAERELLVHGWNDTAAPVDDVSVPALFAEQVARTPNAIAVISGDTTLTYAELDRAAYAFAAALKDRGIGREDIVGLHLDRSPELIAAMLGTQRIGAAFVPLEPSWPAQRITDIHGSARLRAVITATGVGLPALDVPVLQVADLRSDTAIANVRPHPNGLAYVIYTSGTTGTPKGAMILHKAIAARLLWQKEMLGFGLGDAALFKAPLGFDISINEIFLPLVTGGAVVVAAPGAERDVEYLLRLITDHRVSFTYLVASMLDMLLQLPGITAVTDTLKHVWCGGEALTPELFDRFRRTLGATMYHGYGPAEATIGVSHEFYRGDAVRRGVSIGRPNPNTRIHVLDPALNPVPVGVQGELYTGGLPLGRGYVGDPAQTASRFVADPWTPGARLYRTGDLARWTAAGTLEFLGRVDHQVKIRGMRVELQEIEAALAAHDAVRHAVVVTVRGPSGATQLAGYCTGTGLDGDVLRGWLAERLPEHMVPPTIQVLDAIPVTPSGKVDRKALPAPDFTAGARRPVTEVEELVCALFAEVLGLPRVGVDDSFFALGGDSIVSLQLVAKARAAGLVIAPRDVFDSRTAGDLARLVADRTPKTIMGSTIDALGEVPLTPVMRAVLSRDGLRRRYAQAAVVAAPANLDPTALASAVAAVLRHHDALRAVVSPDGDGWRYVVPPAGDGDGVLRAGHGDVRAELDAAADRLDPAAGVMLQVVWFREVIGIVVHHFAVDGVSWRILLPDLADAYAAAVDGRAPQLPPVGTSLRAWAVGLAAANREYEVDYWRSVLDGGDTPLGRGLDPSLDVLSTVRDVRVQLPVDVSRALLTDVPDRYFARVDDVLLTALAVVLRRRGGPTLVELEGHGREDAVVEGADLSRTVGWFTNTYPVRLDIDHSDIGDALKQVKETLRVVPDKGIGYGLLHEPPTPAQITFNYLGRYGGSDATGPWSQLGDYADMAGISDPTAPAPNALEITALTEDTADGPVLRATWCYPEGVLTQEDVMALATGWVDALAELAAQDDAGGHTPSDMPLVAIDQASLDAFEEQWGDL